MLSHFNSLVVGTIWSWGHLQEAAKVDLLIIRFDVGKFQRKFVFISPETLTRMTKAGSSIH